MSDNDIVVFRKYDTVIDANIAKTKLDANDIPCFLTEENISTLYPAQPLSGLKVRLHLFARDEERATKVLEEENMTVESDEGLNRCPSCGSSKIVRDFPRDSADSIAYLIFGVFLPHKKVNHCLDCDNEF